MRWEINGMAASPLDPELRAVAPKKKKTGMLLLFLRLNSSDCPRNDCLGAMSSFSVRFYKDQLFNYLKMHEYYRVI